MIAALPLHNLGTAASTNVTFSFLSPEQYAELKSKGQIVKVRDRDLKPGDMIVGKYKLSKPRRK